MSETVLALEQVSSSKTFFGLKTRLTYKPTQSVIDIQILNYTSESASRLERLLGYDNDRLAREAKSAEPFNATAIGNLRLEKCTSRDGNFVAIQLFRFSDYTFMPVSELKVIEGPEADAVAKLF